MARDKIQVHTMTYDASDSAGSVSITKQAVTQANGIEIEHAYAEKDNSLKIIIENTTTSGGSAADSTVTLKAGDKQNAKLGDLTIALEAGKTTVISPIRDGARFERTDGSIYLDFGSGFTGNIYAAGEKAGLGS